jgi:hypothetical protein
MVAKSNWFKRKKDTLDDEVSPRKKPREAQPKNKLGCAGETNKCAQY